MNFLEPLALYLSLYRFVNGPGAVVPFPGTLQSYVCTNTDSSQDIITKAEIYLSIVKPAEANGEAFNIADTATPSSWSIKWPMLTKYFGLEGTGPNGDDWEPIDRWWKDHQYEYREMRVIHDLKQRDISESAWIFVKAGLTMLNRNREVSLDKTRGIGFTEELPVCQGHYVALDRMMDERILPPRQFLVSSA